MEPEDLGEELKGRRALDQCEPAEQQPVVAKGDWPECRAFQEL